MQTKVDPVLDGDWSIRLIASTLQDGRWPVVSQTEFPIRFVGTDASVAKARCANSMCTVAKVMVMADLKKKGSAQTVKIFRRHGAPAEMFGVKVADLTIIAP